MPLNSLYYTGNPRYCNTVYKRIKIGKSQMSLLTDDKINHVDNPREPRDQLLELRRERSGDLIDKRPLMMATASRTA